MAPAAQTRALVLTGGGARGAYQVGVLKYIGENIPGAAFEVLAGSSAGAINIGMLASSGGDLSKGSELLSGLWGHLRVSKVFRVDPLTLLRIGAVWLYDLTFGGLFGKAHAHYLVDTTPLRKLLRDNFRPDEVSRAIHDGRIRSLALTATEVSTGSAVTFVQGEHRDPWRRTRRRSVAAIIGVEHIQASSAIPFLFSPVAVGRRQYLDGSVRATAPFGPAARLGATKILAVGVRRLDPNEIPPEAAVGEAAEELPSASQVGGLVLNSLFFDNMDADAEHLQRINQLLSGTGAEAAGKALSMRPIDVLVIRPSEDLGRVAKDHKSRLPFFVRYLLRGLGSEQSGSNDIMSYLLFDAAYARHLIDLGYRDAAAQADELRAFFGAS